jgi:VanZ family protein
MRWATIAVIGTAVVASLDEWHQSYIPSRTGTPWDVLLDTSAGIVAQVLVLLWIRWV